MVDVPEPRAPGRVPESHLHAEIATFPLVTEAAFRACIVELDPAFDDRQSIALWRACEARIAEHTNWSLDRIVGIRDETWFGTEPGRRGERAAPVRMHDQLRNLARSRLAATPGLTRTAAEFEQSRLDAEDRNHWLVFAMPEDLLLAGLGIEPAPERVVSDTGLLVRRLLDAGVAEVHQHLGAGMSFPLLWASALASLTMPSLSEHVLEGPATALVEGRNLIRWLLVAAIARCVLGEYLVRGARGRAGASLTEFVASLRGPNSALSQRQRRTLVASLIALELAEDARLPDFLDLRELYADLHPSVREFDAAPLRSVDDAFARCDPLALRVGATGFNAGERWLQREALAHLDGSPTRDRMFEVVWWQIVRIRCIYYRAIVERPQNTGLQWFIRFYDRIGKLRTALEPLLVEASFATAGEGQPIAALEVRTSAEKSPIALAEQLLGILRSWGRVGAQVGEQPRAPEFGVVLHFIKQRDSTRRWARGAPAAYWTGTHAEPTFARDGLELGDFRRERYRDLFNEQARRAAAVAELIEAAPSVLWLLRGLDVAADELGVPTWVFVPLFGYVRQVAEIASRRRDAGPPLGLTAHVGEDFRHLLEGMRRVYEQVHYVLGSAGGRLGHAVALGLDPQLWADSSRSVVMPTEERLWDLVMEWRLHTRHRIASDFATQPPAGRIDQLRNHICELSAFVFGRASEPQILAEAHHALHCFLLPERGEPWRVIEGGLDVFERALARLARIEGVRFVEPVRLLLEEYLTCDRTFRRGQSPIEVATDELEIAALQAVQAGLRRGIARRGIVVEVNPSSNLLIGDLVDLRNHPILRLCPPEREPGDLPPVAIAVGSDDPVTFSTSLLHEYVLLHRAARAAGYPERTVQAWLDTIRQTGMDARMTVTWRPTTAARAERIGEDLARFASLPRTRGG